jgi:hypothetical protein
MLSDIGRVAWNRWRIIGDVYGNFQARLFAVLFYFTLFVPFALGVRLLGDPMNVRKLPKKWLDRVPVGDTLDEARRQF